MSLHKEDITSRLSRFLDRKSPPLRLRTQTAQDDEMRTLISKITANAPRNADALAEWWPHFEAELGDRCGDFWPSEKHIKPAAEFAAKQTPRKSVTFDGADMRDFAIAARRMQQGDAVGEAFLYGIKAVEMIAAQLIDQDTMTRYRSAAYFDQVRQYGEEVARRWEDAAKASHEAAKAVFKARNSDRGHGGAMPDKSVSDEMARAMI